MLFYQIVIDSFQSLKNLFCPPVIFFVEKCENVFSFVHQKLEERNSNFGDLSRNLEVFEIGCELEDGHLVLDAALVHQPVAVTEVRDRREGRDFQFWGVRLVVGVDEEDPDVLQLFVDVLQVGQDLLAAIGLVAVGQEEDNDVVFFFDDSLFGKQI